MAISLLLLASRRATEPRLADTGYGYGTSPRQRLVSAGLALGIAGGIGAALVLAIVAPEMRERLDPPIIGTHIPIPTPIDPDPQPPIDRPQAPTDSTLRAPPIADTFPPLGNPPIGTVDTGPIAPLGPVIGEGSGGGTAIDVIPTPVPVLVDATRDPRFARQFQPTFPPALEREGITGTARVRIRIGTDGRVISIANLGATDPAFFAATERQALRHWRFRPATRDGVPVESTQVLTVRFELPADE